MKNVTPRGIYAHSSSLKTVLKLAFRKGVIFHVFPASGGNRKASPKCKTSLLRTNLLPLLKISDYHNAHFILFHFYRNLRFKKGRRVETRLLRNSRKFQGIIGYNRFLNDPSRCLQDEIPKNFQKISGVYRIPHSNSHVSPRARASISAMLNSSVLSVFVSMFPCQQSTCELKHKETTSEILEELRCARMSKNYKPGCTHRTTFQVFSGKERVLFQHP